MPDDPHLIDKITTATSNRELDGLRDAFKARGDEMPGAAIQALALKRAELQIKEKGKRR